MWDGAGEISSIWRCVKPGKVIVLEIVGTESYSSLPQCVGGSVIFGMVATHVLEINQATVTAKGGK